MRWSDIPLRPSTAALRQFAGLWILFLGGAGCWRLFHDGAPGRGGVFILLALGVGLPGLLYPRLLRPLFVGWMCLVFPLAWIVSHALLAVVFYGILTPLGLCFRVIGRDVLALRRRRGYDSFWKPKPMAADQRSYFRQS